MDFQGLPVSLIMPDWGKVCRDRGERPGGAQYGNHIPWPFGELGANGDRDPLIFFFWTTENLPWSSPSNSSWGPKPKGIKWGPKPRSADCARYNQHQIKSRAVNKQESNPEWCASTTHPCICLNQLGTVTGRYRGPL